MDDKKFFIEKGDPNFDPERNKRVIQETIQKYEANRAQKLKDFNEQLEERTDASMWYLKHVSEKGTPVEKYFSRRELASLQGRKIIQKLQEIKGQKFYSLDSI